MRRLIFLEKNAKTNNYDPIKPVSIGRVCPKNPHHKGRKHARQGRFSFSAGLLRRSTGLAAGKRLIILKEGVE
jgi:hypothetical protein